MADRTSRTFFGIYINGDQANDTLRDLRLNSNRLKNELALLVPGTEAYKRKMAELQGTEKWIRRHREEVAGLNTVWSKVKNEVKAFGVIALGALGANAVLQGLTNMIRKTAELSDVMADVRRTTGMTKSEVENLNKELGKINTRTSRKELLELAKEAGKLGYSSTADVKKFVQQADEIHVALGEDLGKDAIVTIGKLSNIFKIEMSKIGDALNEVGQASVATEGWQVDFMMRMAGVAETVKLTVPEVLGFGATLEMLGQTAEVSGTAMSQMFLKLIRDTEKFERIAGFANGELSKIIGEQGSQAGMVAFITKLKEGSVSTQDLAQKLDELGLDGVRSAGVLLSLANNIGEVADQTSIASKAVEQNISTHNEFMRRQETFGAAMDRLQKKLYQIATDNFIVNGFRRIVTALFDTTTESQKLTQEMTDLTKATDALEKKVDPLVKRYEELTGKAELSKDEQKEVKDIIKTISELIPTAVTKWDDYGNAIEISTGKVRDAITENRRLASLLNADAVKELRDEMAKLKKDRDFAIASLNRELEGETIVDPKTGFASKGAVNLDNVRKYQQEIAQLNALAVSNLTTLRDTLGEDLTMLEQFELQMAQASIGLTTAVNNAATGGDSGDTGSAGSGGHSTIFGKAAEELAELGEVGEPALILLEALATNYERVAHAIANLNSPTDGYPALKESMQDINALEEERKKGLDELKNKELEKIARLEYEVELAYEQGMRIAENAESFKDATHEFLALMRQRLKAALAEMIVTYMKQMFKELGWTGPLGLAAAVGLTTIGAGIITSAFEALVPSFAEGGFMDVTGAKNKHAYRAKVDQKFSGGYLTNPVLVGEAGLEYTVPSWMMNMPKVADTVGLLESIRSSGGTQGAPTVNNTTNNTYQNTATDSDTLERLTSVLERLEQQGVRNVIGDRVIEELWKRKDLLDGLQKKARN